MRNHFSNIFLLAILVILIEAQNMGERMEKGLQQRAKFMTEEQERNYKKDKKIHF